MQKKPSVESSLLELAVRFAFRHELPISEALAILSSREARQCKSLRSLLGKAGESGERRAETILS